MSIDWECAFALGETGQAKALPCSSAMMTLGLEQAPILIAAVEAGNDGFASQIAVKMSTEAVMDSALSVVTAESFSGNVAEIVTAGFKAANDTVYEYSHRMAAGGTFAAKAVVAGIDRGRVSLGQLGGCDSFLLRDNTLLSFYDSLTSDASAPRDALLARFIGANVKIAVDTASLSVERGDRIAVCTRTLGVAGREVLCEALAGATSAQGAADSIAASCFDEVGRVGESFVQPMVFVMFARDEH